MSVIKWNSLGNRLSGKRVRMGHRVVETQLARIMAISDFAFETQVLFSHFFHGSGRSQLGGLHHTGKPSQITKMAHLIAQGSIFKFSSVCPCCTLTELSTLSFIFAPMSQILCNPSLYLMDAVVRLRHLNPNILELRLGARECLRPSMRATSWMSVFYFYSKWSCRP